MFDCEDDENKIIYICTKEKKVHREYVVKLLLIGHTFTQHLQLAS